MTATRTPRAQARTPAAVTVIDREDIERLQPASLADLLAGQAGLALANNGGAGKTTSLFVRGTESDHVLVLVDGIPLGSATSGGASLQDLPPEQIERIEIARGPFSSLYGSEALGGVLQIFTRHPRTGASPAWSTTFGSAGTQRSTLGFGSRSRSTTQTRWYAVNATHGRTDGINAYRGTRNFDPDLDGYRNNALTLQGGLRFNERWSADLRAFRAEGRNEYDGSMSNVSETVQQVVGGSLRYAAGEHLRVSLQLGRSADLSDNYRNRTFVSTFDTRRCNSTLQADLDAMGGLWTFGVDQRTDRVASTTHYARTRRDNLGAFGQFQRDVGSQSWLFGLRRDVDDQFGGVTTGSAAWAWRPADRLQLSARFGSAYKAPTFNELYFPGYGNPQLRPERARSLELGARGTYARSTWSANVFETRIDDLIAYDADLRPAPGPNNIDRARIRGVEIGGDVALDDWRLRGSLTWLDPRADGDNASRGHRLPRRPARSGRIDLDRAFGRFDIGASVVGSGMRYENLANTRRMHGYGLLELRADVAIASQWHVQASILNALDTRYESAEFYPQPGRQWQFALRYQPLAR